MTPEQWVRVKELFHAALAQDATRRSAFLEAETGGDERVRAEVERLLEADVHAAGFIEHPAAATLLSGRVISHYEIRHLLGSGGMGRVYAAHDTELDREVALKVASVDSPDAQARLRREAQHASRLSHPHICHIYEVGRADGQLFVVMELVGGRSLADAIREGPLTVADTTRYGMEMADALAHAHDRGVIHRDLKSTNVMITNRGAKVLDFGLARMLDTHQIDALSHSQRSLTGEGLIAGTLPYMAPELLRGERGDQRADIWALGVLLYEMVGGRRPFTGNTGFELSAAILHQPPEALSAGIPTPLAAVIQRCLAKDPRDRYQSAAEVHDALEEAKKPPVAIASKRPLLTATRVGTGLLLLVVGLAVAATIGDRIEQEPVESTDVGNARGYGLLQAGQFERAVEEFRAITERDPASANLWDSLGEGYLANGMAEKSFDAYSRALTIDPTFASAMIGRTLALGAMGRYDEALAREPPDFRVRAFLVSRLGRYGEATAIVEMERRESPEDARTAAAASVISALLFVERGQYARALDELRAAETALTKDGESDHPLLVFADLVVGVAEIRSGNVGNAVTRLGSQRARHDNDEPSQRNWVAALDGEIALAQREYDRAISAFMSADSRAWLTLADTEAVFGLNPPSRDGRARVEMARGNRAAAIDEYRRLTAAGPESRSSALLEPRHVLALARLLDEDGQAVAARTEYSRFLKLWANADRGLPELDEARRAIARLEKGVASPQGNRRTSGSSGPRST